MALSSTKPVPSHLAPERPAPPEARQRVFMPPPQVLRQLAREEARATAPRPLPSPPDAAKSRISIGAPSPVRQREPLILRRDQDVTQTRKGRPDAAPEAADAETAPRTDRAAQSAAAQLPAREPSLRLPPGGDRPAAPDSRDGRSSAPSIASSLRNLDRVLKTSGQSGTRTGTGQQMGPLFFDPEGADFTRWIETFRTEVYRNWILPQPALMGLRGHVEIEFTVQRDGSVTGLSVIRPSGVPAFDRAAQNSLTSGRFLPLPADFRPASVTMRVVFFYNEAPQGA